MVSLNMITNFPITSCNIQNANNVFGPKISSMKGKSFMRQPEVVVSDYVEIPKEILGINTELEILVDIVFVNNFPFLVSVIKKIKFRTV